MARAYAYCRMDGRITFDVDVPDGAIGIATGDRDVLAKVLGQTAVTEVNEQTLVVPGMRESNTQRGALSSLAQYIQQLDQLDTPGFRALGA